MLFINCLHEDAFLFVTDDYVRNLLNMTMRSIQRETCIRFAELSYLLQPAIHHVYFAPIHHEWYE